jgi:hypothetical protein
MIDQFPIRRVGGMMLGAALLAGCATEAPTFSPVAPIPAGKGVVYLYRPPEGGQEAGAGPLVSANKVPLANLGRGEYFSLVGRPGPLYFQTGTQAANIGYVNLETGKEKYLKGVIYGGHLKFSPMAPEAARREIAECMAVERAPAATGRQAPAAEATARPASTYAPVRREPTLKPSGHAAVTPAARPRRRPSTSAGRAVAAGAPAREQGPLSFEAERIAMANGCTTPDGIRPTAFLVERGDEGLQVYDVACWQQHMRVDCQFEYCELTTR